jgi:predicted RNase H-like nuclease
LTLPDGILALDPAGTQRQPSGVACLSRRGEGWHCAGVAPSYVAFLNLAEGIPVDWSARPAGGLPEPARLLDAAGALLGGEVSTVTVDMPVSLVPFDSRRVGDNLISSEYGRYGCGTHTPNKDRPGRLGADLTRAFAKRGYGVAGADAVPGESRALVEVYPHPALLVLLGEEYRVKYKAGKARKFWPELTAGERRAAVVTVWGRIREVLRSVISGIDLPLPTATEATTMTTTALKRYEDTLDALVCGWVGMEYLEGHCTAFGDASAAIWAPAMARPTSRPQGVL